MVFQRLQEVGMTIRIRKCQFFRRSMKFLGYIVDQEGMRPDPERVEAVRHFPTPKNVHQVRAFLGLCSFDRRFCPSFASATEPLVNLLRKKSRWKWDMKEQSAFETIKRKICEATLVYRPHPKVKYYVQADASDEGLGAQLYQRRDGERQVVAYASRLLSEQERRYHTSEKEALAILFALQKWRTQLLGVKFTVRTDHKALIFLQRCRLLSPRIARWALAMQEFDFDIEYVKGEENVVADVLSRFVPRLPSPSNGQFRLMALKKRLHSEDLRQAVQNIGPLQHADPRLRAMLEKNAGEENGRIIIHGGILFVRQGEDEVVLLAIPESIIDRIIISYHINSGHFGSWKTWRLLRCDVWFPNLSRRVKLVLRGCDICQRAKSSIHPAPEFQSIIPDGPNKLVAMDFYGPLPRSRAGVQYLLVLMDVYSKFITLFPVKKATTRSVIRSFDRYMQDVGKPERILCDQGTQFTSASWKAYVDELEVALSFVSVRHPQANPSERVMRELGRLCRTYCHQKHTSWAVSILEIAEFLNNITHESTGFAPIELHFGLPAKHPLRASIEYPGVPPAVPEGRLVLAQESLLSKAARRRASQRVRNHTFQEGDLVLLRSNPVSSAVDGIIKKFCLLYEGPFRIKKKIHSNTYILCNNENVERGSFHAIHLKPYHSPS